MADIIPPGYAECLLPLTHNSLARSAAITWGVDMNGQGGSVTLAGKIQNDFDLALGENIDNEVMMGPLVLRVGQDGGDALVFEAPGAVPGTAVGNRVSANTALLVRKVTSRGGRRGRGRFYVPWLLSETDVNEIGIVDSASLAIYQTDCDALLTNLATTVGPSLGTPMVLLHSTGTTATPLPDPVTALQAMPLVGSQRRRLGR